MKVLKILIIASFLLLGFISVNKALANEAFRSRCVGITGTFNAKNWNGGPVMVGCAGDDGGAVSDPKQKCSGEVKTVNPGQQYRLTKCSCFGGSGGCLIIGKKLTLSSTLTKLAVGGKYKIIVNAPLDSFGMIKSGKCKFTPTKNVCGSNGQRISENFKITCKVPNVTPTPTTPKGSTPTPTPKICVAPNVVTNVKVTCPSCFGNVPTPTVTITPTPEPSASPTPEPTVTPLLLTPTPTPTGGGI